MVNHSDFTTCYIVVNHKVVNSSQITVSKLPHGKSNVVYGGKKHGYHGKTNTVCRGENTVYHGKKFAMR